jgi:aspartyl-tRNA(Asn)/glutamyl-tRNA(Gln) amidotransferase subunit B
LIRIHIEEDAGKNIHSEHKNESFVDLNRAGTPLLEIVSYPNISSSYEAKEYLKTLRLIVQYIKICTGNMEEGAFRADTNISVRKKGETKLGTKCELKNINSFKFISDAIDYEIERQIDILESGGSVKQETRLWDTKNHKTVVMREKDEAADYRYMYDPDLPLIEIVDSYIEDIRSKMEELPDQKFKRLVNQSLSEYEADILVNDIDLSNYYDETIRYYKSKTVINLLLRDILSFVKDSKLSINDIKFRPKHLASLAKLLDTNVINNKIAQDVFKISSQTGKLPEEVIQEYNLKQLDNEEDIKNIIIDIINNNPCQVSDYKAGKDKLFGFFVGQVMQKTKGKANPDIVNKLLKDLLLK